MKRLFAIGFWNDGIDGCPFHNPHEFVDPNPNGSVREALSHYLRSGNVAARYVGYSWCRFDCGIAESEMGSAELSDGVWIWPEGLAHYVARHDVRLPEEFVEHAHANEFRISGPPLEGGVIGDAGFWSDWCDANTNDDPEARALWRRTPDEIDVADRETIERLIEKHGGLSEQRCARAGCHDRALHGLAFCPACAHHKLNHWS